VGDRWFVDETYVKISGRRVCLYRALDRYGHGIDMLVLPKRDLAATRRFFTRALEHGTRPTEVTTAGRPLTRGCWMSSCRRLARHRTICEQPGRSRSQPPESPVTTDTRPQTMQQSRVEHLRGPAHGYRRGSAHLRTHRPALARGRIPYQQHDPPGPSSATTSPWRSRGTEIGAPFHRVRHARRPWRCLDAFRSFAGGTPNTTGSPISRTRHNPLRNGAKITW
jgi:hypothetical protein